MSRRSRPIGLRHPPSLFDPVLKFIPGDYHFTDIPTEPYLKGALIRETHIENRNTICKQLEERILSVNVSRLPETKSRF